MARLQIRLAREQRPGARLDDAELLASELVSNAVRHSRHRGDAPIRLVVSVDARSLRVEVHDPGPGFDSARVNRSAPPPEQAGGRGLYLVQSVADRWGQYRLGPTHCVWVELDHR